MDGPDDVVVDGRDDFVDVDDGAAGIEWRFERSFLTSNWTCIWGHGLRRHRRRACAGAAARVLLGRRRDGRRRGGDDHLGAGDDDPAGAVAAPPPRSTTTTCSATAPRHQHQGRRRGVHLPQPARASPAEPGARCTSPRSTPASRHSTGSRRCAGSCRSASTGRPQPDGTEVATVRRWSRADWGAEGSTMAWCCTEGPDGLRRCVSRSSSRSPPSRWSAWSVRHR